MNTTSNNISDEQLNALLDKELDADEEAQLLQAIAASEELYQRYEALRKTKSLFIQAYEEVPQPMLLPQQPGWTFGRAPAAIAASIVLFVGIYLGWLLEPFFPHEQFPHATLSQQSPGRIQSLTEIDAALPQSKTILLHISTTEQTRVEHVLQLAETLLATANKRHLPLQLEIVANADGLNILRKGSPYADKISALSEQFNNVRFLACGIAKKTAALKEGRAIELLPEATDIPAALDQILRRLKDGWTYIRG